VQYEFARSAEEVRQRHRTAHQGRAVVYAAVVLGTEADETLQCTACRYKAGQHSGETSLIFVNFTLLPCIPSACSLAKEQDALGSERAY